MRPENRPLYPLCATTIHLFVRKRLSPARHGGFGLDTSQLTSKLALSRMMSVTNDDNQFMKLIFNRVLISHSWANYIVYKSTYAAIPVFGNQEIKDQAGAEGDIYGHISFQETRRAGHGTGGHGIDIFR
ncbi:MAG: hypothetical protein ABID63_06255 [Pseudomonadota bacterium]